MLRLGRRLTGLMLVFLIIEFLDELLFGITEAAWPLIRSDFALDYIQIGLLLSLPELASILIEPVVGILGDVWHRRRLMIGGGVCFALAALIAALGQDYSLLLLAFILIYPASGTFVGLAQASLMDHAPNRHEQNMARWVVAGSVGVLLGPLLLLGFIETGGSWRGAFGFWALLTLLATLFYLLRSRKNGEQIDEDDDTEASQSFWDGLKAAWRSLREPDVLRWLVLLEFSDLLLDGLTGYVALYFVDVVGTEESIAVGIVALDSLAGLLGSLLLIPLLERISGLRYLRWSAILSFGLYPLFLLLPGIELKLICLALLSFNNAGWYTVLQAQLYSAMPERSGTVLSLSNVVALPASLLPLLIGAVASQFGLQTALWLLLLAPLALLLGLPGRKKVQAD